MQWFRIYALILRYLYIYPRSVPRILDILFWPIVELLLWGFLTMFLRQSQANVPQVILIILGALVFWNFIQRSQQAISIAFLEEVWERNLLNLFVTPIRLREFLMATVFVGLFRLVVIAIVICIAAFFLFQFNIFYFGFYLIPFVINLFLFGWVLGMISTSMIMRFGQSAQVLAFALTFLLQPFMAVFYPVRILPEWLQPIALAIPVTHVFEGMRQVVLTGSLSWSAVFWATGLNSIWLVISLLIFTKMFDYVKESGQMLRLVD